MCPTSHKPQLRTVSPTTTGRATYYVHIHAWSQVVPPWEGLRCQEPQHPQGYEVGYPAQQMLRLLARGDLARDGES